MICLTCSIPLVYSERFPKEFNMTAFAAFAAAIAAVFQAIFAGLVFWFVIKQTQISRKQSEISEVQAKIAETQNQLLQLHYSTDIVLKAFANPDILKRRITTEEYKELVDIVRTVKHFGERIAGEISSTPPNSSGQSNEA